MAPIVLTVEVGRPPAEVFSYVTDPQRFSEWQPDAVASSMTGTGPLGVGSTYTMTRRIGWIKPTARSQVTEFEPPRTWAVHGIDGPIRQSTRGRVEPLGHGTRSRVTIEVDFAGHGIGKLIAPLVRWLGHKDALPGCRNLKERLESGESWPPGG